MWQTFFKYVKLLILLLIGLGAVALGITFSSENSQLVSLMLFGSPLPQWQLGVWMLLSLLIGAVLGLVLAFLSSLGRRPSAFLKERQLKQLQKELDSLRASTVKG